MPNIDVTVLMTDPDFCTTFQLRVRHEAVGTDGRALFTDEWAVVTAIVQPARGRDLIREDGSSRGSGTIVIYSTMPMTVAAGPNGPDATLSADQVLYRGQTYTVTAVEDWLEYGYGFVKAIAEQDALQS